jgi:hypothetical protein
MVRSMAGVGLNSSTEPHGDHLVQIYSREVELAEAAATFFAAGFHSGEPAVAIATTAHWPLIAERLTRKGWDLDELTADDLLHVRDAETTLDALLEDGGPSLQRFEDTVGGLLREVMGRRPGRRVRAFGEMVDLLVDRGDPVGAEVLEGHWNAIATKLNFRLLCGYRIDYLRGSPDIALLAQIHRSHAHVLPGDDEERLAAAVERALVEVLGEDDTKKLYAQISGSKQRAPMSQLVLTWMNAHMPRLAGKVLAAATAHYDDVAAA